MDRHLHKSIASTPYTNDLSPDIVVYAAGRKHIDFNIISVGKLKAGPNITEEHCGQLAMYAQALFDRHPHRNLLHG